MYLWYGIKGTVDKKLSAGLDALKKSGYPFEVKIFTEALATAALPGSIRRNFQRRSRRRTGAVWKRRSYERQRTAI